MKKSFVLILSILSLIHVCFTSCILNENEGEAYKISLEDTFIGDKFTFESSIKISKDTTYYYYRSQKLGCSVIVREHELNRSAFSSSVEVDTNYNQMLFKNELNEYAEGLVKDLFLPGEVKLFSKGNIFCGFYPAVESEDNTAFENYLAQLVYSYKNDAADKISFRVAISHDSSKNSYEQMSKAVLNKVKSSSLSSMPFYLYYFDSTEDEGFKIFGVNGSTSGSVESYVIREKAYSLVCEKLQ